MRIVAYLGVKDEVELIERTIKHLRAIGVDLIIAVDSRSTDGTVEILKSHESKDNFWLFQMDELGRDDTEQIWARRNMEIIQRAEADWVILLDADEFWLPLSGSLKDSSDLCSSDVLSVDRFNVPLQPSGAMLPDELIPSRYSEILLFVEPIPNLQRQLQENPCTPWIRGVPVPKVMARAKQIAGWTLGMHDAIPALGTEPARSKPSDLIIAHLPFTTFSRFARKIENIRSVFARFDAYFPGQMGWHWRRWVRLAEEGRLREEFEKQICTEDAVAEFRRRRILCSATELLEDRMVERRRLAVRCLRH
jgi:glycosyltransferase involved in cell wall biosynthesis